MQDRKITVSQKLRAHTMYSLWFIGGFTLALTLFLTTGITHEYRQESHGKNRNTTHYPLINPLLECREGEGISNQWLGNAPYQVKRYIDTAIAHGSTNHVSVYYRNLNNGPWFGVNEYEAFSPASLLKVPLLFTVLKESEQSPSLLDKKVLYAGTDEPSDQQFTPQKQIEVGSTYSVAELTERMIRFSDNEAALILLNILTSEKALQTYHDLNLPMPTNGIVDFMTVKEYATFFRVLYNASYLEKKTSQVALELLSTTVFNNGLREGVPSSIPIAHKFGEFWKVGDTQKQLHDCGIIYEPQQPYLLCVMTRGTDFDTLAKVIKDISKIVYQSITTRL